MSLSLLFAQGSPNSWQYPAFIAVIIAVMYFLLLRPERKRQQEHQAMLEGLKKNDKVVTAGGIRGIVHAVKDDEVTLRVDESKGVLIRFSKSSIASVLKETTGKDSEDSAKDDKDSKDRKNEKDT